MKCYCGFDWNEDTILKGYEKDEFGVFFRCTVDHMAYDEWNSCMGYVACESSNGWINQLFTPLYKKYLKIKEDRRIKELQKGNRLLEEFL